MKKYTIFVIIILIFVNAACFARKSDAEANIYFSNTGSKSFFDYYKNSLNSDDNVLLTSDFILYIEHLITDYSLRYMENNYLIKIYKNMLLDMIYENEQLYSDYVGCEDAYDLNRAYLYTCLLLLDKDIFVPADIASAVDREIELIEGHKGEYESFVFEHKEDYSQYIPRGHYNDTKLLRQYFRSMMYFQRMRYRTIIEKTDPFIELKAALMMSEIMQREHVISSFNDFYSIISFYLQSSDDILVGELKAMIPFEITEGNLTDSTLMRDAARVIAEHDQARIISDIVADNEDVPVFTGIMGQRYIFDSEVFTQLVYNRVGEYTGSNPQNVFTYGGKYRIMPRGLDLFSVIGSPEARNILNKEGDTEYRGYNKNVSIMSEIYNKLDNSSFYNRMLKQYDIIINTDDFSFMNGTLKKQKELNTMLSSWASLRHDVILYAKQSYTAKITSAGPKPLPKEKRIIAEPYIAFYSQAGDDIDELLFMLYESTDDRIFSELRESMDNIIGVYMLISQLTLKGDYYSDKDKLTAMLSSIDYQLKQLIGDKKEKTDNTIIIADVHTDPNSKTVLQEASGYINEITVDMDGEPFRGGVLSYYEFRHSMNDRLTDEKWRDIIQLGSEQYLAPWQRGLFENNSR